MLTSIILTFTFSVLVCRVFAAISQIMLTCLRLQHHQWLSQDRAQKNGQASRI